MRNRREIEILLIFLGVAAASYAWVSAFAPERTSLILDSGQGEYIGQGKRWQYSALNAKVSSRYNYNEKAESGVKFEFQARGQRSYFELQFAGPDSQKLAPGHYENAARFPFQKAGQPGLSISGCGRGNNRLQGSFDVLEIEYGESGPKKLAVDFVQYGDGDLSHPLRGSLRYHSDSP